MAEEKPKQQAESSLTKEQQAAHFASIVGEENFDKDKFELDVQKLKDDGLDLSLLRAMDYRKEKNNSDKKPDYDNGQLSFSTQRRGRGIVIIGSDGSRMEARTPEEKHKMVAQAYKQRAANGPEEKRKNLTVAYESANKDPADMELFAKTFINEGIAVDGDVPQNPKFWQEFKKEYLTNPEHSVEQWNHLTRKVPPEYMGEKSREQTKTQSLLRQKIAQKRTETQQRGINREDFVRNLRNGNNPSLSPTAEKPVKARNTVQVQEINVLRRSMLEAVQEH